MAEILNVRVGKGGMPRLSDLFRPAKARHTVKNIWAMSFTRGPKGLVRRVHTG